ncbi:hypothetical protein EON65_56290, partial [archaeon]
MLVSSILLVLFVVARASDGRMFWSTLSGVITHSRSLDAAKSQSQQLDCSNGTCKLPSAADPNGVQSDDEHGSLVAELEKMGWSRSDAERALCFTNNDPVAAATLLEEEQEVAEIIELAVQKVTQAGWSREAAQSAVNATFGNVTTALSMLAEEESIITQNFNSAVQDMV